MGSSLFNPHLHPAHTNEITWPDIGIDIPDIIMLSKC